MGKFIGDFYLQPIIPSPNTWYYTPIKLPYTKGLTYISNNEKIYELSEPFTTDLASVPRFMWNIKNFSTGDWPRPALLHDWLFQLNHFKRPITSFTEANNLLYESLRSEGCNKLVAFLYKNACQTFGKCIWDN